MRERTELRHRGRLREQAETELSLLESCSACPGNCAIDRLAGDVRECRTSRAPIVSGYEPHFGEETRLVGSYGSDTMLLTSCNPRCPLCQNYGVSQTGEGKKVSNGTLACIMLSLQFRACQNIDLVSPIRVIPQVLEALTLAVESGLHIALVYSRRRHDFAEASGAMDSFCRGDRSNSELAQ